MSDEFVYYAAAPEHRPFIIKSAMKALRLSPETADLADNEYYEWAKPHVARYVERFPSVVALDPENLDTIVAFLTYDDQTQVFAYTRKQFRGFGIYERLKKISGITGYSHRSRGWNHRRSGLDYRPWWMG